MFCCEYCVILCECPFSRPIIDLIIYAGFVLIFFAFYFQVPFPYHIKLQLYDFKFCLRWVCNKNKMFGNSADTYQTVLAN